MLLNPPHSRLSKNLRAPHWHTYANAMVPALPVILRRWLFSADSLTSRLQQICQEPLRVEVLQHGLSRPALEEAHVLGLPAGRYALVREVRLLDGDTGLVEARSILPRTVLQGHWRILARLGTRPLGEIIFTRPGLHRDALELALPARHGCWGRRNHYRLSGRPFLVSEFFLPEMLRRLTVLSNR